MKLPAEIQIGIRDRSISMGHARSLLSLPSEEEQIRMFKEIVSSGLSVRDIEEHVKTKNYSKKGNRVPSSLDKKTKNEIAALYQSDISISMSKEGSGRLSFKFDSPQDMERLVKLLLNK